MSSRSAKKAPIMSEKYQLYRDLVLEFLDVWQPEPEDKWLITYLRNRIDVKYCMPEGTFNLLTRKINRSILKDFYKMNCDEVMAMNPNELFRLMYCEQKRLKWDYKQTQQWICCVHRIKKEL